MFRVLIACEVTGTFRDAFRELGCDAWSVDLLSLDDIPHELAARQRFGNYHYVGDCRWFFDGSTGMPHDWDLIIAHPPCRYLANSGVRWLGNSIRGYNAVRFNKMYAAADLVRDIWNASCENVLIENSIMHGYARRALEVRGVAPDRAGRFSFSTQPSEYGVAESKRACWWVKGELTKPEPTEYVAPELIEPVAWKLPPSEWRWLYRSLFHPDYAMALAQDWLRQLEAIHATS